MKNKATVFLKQILAVLSSIVKAKSMAAKTKSSAIKTRFLIFSLMKNKKVLMGSVSQKIHALLAGNHHQDGDNKKNDDNDFMSEEDRSKAIVLYNSYSNQLSNGDQQYFVKYHEEEDDDDDKYPDLTHTLFESDCEDFDDQTGSVIDLVRNSKEEDGKDFRLEDEIDHVADLFIRRFHRQIKMQKQESFNRYQEMLERSV